MAMVIVGVLLLVLKLTAVSVVAQWSWWAVLAPFMLAIVWWHWADTSGWTKRREMEKLDARKQERREKNLVALGLDVKSRRKR